MAKVTIDEARCIGCGLCLPVCPKNVLILATDHINARGYNPAVPVKMDACTACAFCARMCPDSAIMVEK